MDDSKLYKKVTAGAKWIFSLPNHSDGKFLAALHGMGGLVRPESVSPSSINFAVPETSSELPRIIDLAMSSGMVPSFSRCSGPGEFKVFRRMTEAGERGRFKCRFWTVLQGTGLIGDFLRWNGKTAVGVFHVDHRRKVPPPPICSLRFFDDLVFREDLAEKFVARGWPGIQFEPFEFERSGGTGLLFPEKYFTLSVSRLMPRRHGVMEQYSEIYISGQQETVLHRNLNGIAPSPQVFATDSAPDGDLVRSIEPDYTLGTHESHQLFASDAFRAWAKAEGIPLGFGNAFFLDSFENLTATEYISRLKEGGALW